MGAPEVAGVGLPVAGFQIGHRRLVHLHIAAIKDGGFYLFIKGAQPEGGERHPAGHGLTGEINAVARLIDVFLTVEREVVAVLGGDDGGEESGGGEAGVLEGRRQGGDDGRGFSVTAAHVFGTHGAAFEEAGGFVVELFADFLSDAFPRGGVGFDFVRLEDLFDHGEVLGQARAAGGGGRRGAVGCGRGLPGVSASLLHTS